MAPEIGRLESDMLFLGLTRPAMILGVTYSWFLAELLFWALYFINMTDFLVVTIGSLGTHLLGNLIMSKEPRFLEIISIWAKTNSKCTNKRFHGNTHSYDLY